MEKAPNGTTVLNDILPQLVPKRFEQPKRKKQKQDLSSKIANSSCTKTISIGVRLQKSYSPPPPPDLISPHRQKPAYYHKNPTNFFIRHKSSHTPTVTLDTRLLPSFPFTPPAYSKKPNVFSSLEFMLEELKNPYFYTRKTPSNKIPSPLPMGPPPLGRHHTRSNPHTYRA